MRYIGGQKNGESWYWEIRSVPNSRKMPDKITAVVGLFQKDGKYLVIKNKRGWDLPGGHIEASETADQAIVREVLEEANATVTNLHHLALLLSSYDPTQETYILVYKGKVEKSGNFVPTEEISDRNFFTQEEFISQYAGNKDLLRELFLLEIQKTGIK